MRGILFFLFVVVFSVSHGQTTFILVRHAEKMDAAQAADPKDPDLSEAGRQRAARLAALLKETKIDAIFSTAYKRTQNTVAPLAAAKAITVKTYQPKDEKGVDEMLASFSAGTIVVCGHSNTVPWMANILTGKQDIKDFDDSDYDNVLVVQVSEKGKGKVVWMNY